MDVECLSDSSTKLGINSDTAYFRQDKFATEKM